MFKRQSNHTNLEQVYKNSFVWEGGTIFYFLNFKEILSALLHPTINNFIKDKSDTDTHTVNKMLITLIFLFRFKFQLCFAKVPQYAHIVRGIVSSRVLCHAGVEFKRLVFEHPGDTSAIPSAAPPAADTAHIVPGAPVARPPQPNTGECASTPGWKESRRRTSGR